MTDTTPSSAGTGETTERAGVAVADFDVILTLDGRSDILLETLAHEFRMTDSQVFREVQSTARHLRALLGRKGIDYADLKRALVPSTDRAERAFLFDWTAFDVGFYGGPVMECLLPALDKRSTRSVLAGDWISKLRPRAALRDSDLVLMPPAGRPSSGHLPDTLYVVYLNNLTPAMVSDLDRAFAVLPAYAGSIDMTYTSLFKALLSTMLVRDFVQHKAVFLVAHEDDRDEREDHSPKLFGVVQHGFRIRSVPHWLYGRFLSYKIERPVFDFDRWDAHASLIALTPAPIALEECEVVLEEEKLGYLQSAKADSLKRADLHGMSAAAISEQIKRKLAANYIYNLARSESLGTLKFNIVLENRRLSRCMCALEYKPREQQLRVITFF